MFYIYNPVIWDEMSYNKYPTLPSTKRLKYEEEESLTSLQDADNFNQTHNILYHDKAIKNCVYNFTYEAKIKDGVICD